MSAISLINYIHFLFKVRPPVRNTNLASNTLLFGSSTKSSSPCKTSFFLKSPFYNQLTPTARKEMVSHCVYHKLGCLDNFADSRGSRCRLRLSSARTSPSIVFKSGHSRFSKISQLDRKNVLDNHFVATPLPSQWAVTAPPSAYLICPKCSYLSQIRGSFYFKLEQFREEAMP